MVVERSSLPDQVFRGLVEAVLSGQYAPGDRLPPQRALAADLGVNMASLREGIKRLEQLRLVDVRHGDAMRVNDWRARGGLDVLTYAAAADPRVVASLFEARRLLLTEAARLAAQRREPDDFLVLLEAAQAFEEADDDAAAQAADLSFFRGLIDSSGNVVFRMILNSIAELYLERLELFRAIVSDRHEYAPLYREAVHAITEGDADGAADAVSRLAAAQEARMLAALGRG